MEGGAARGVTPIHAELGDLSWKNCWVTRVAVCRRVALPLGMGEGLLSALGAWRPCGLPVPSPCHSRPEEGAGGAALAICEMSWVRQGWRGSHFQSGLAWACYPPPVSSATLKATPFLSSLEIHLPGHLSRPVCGLSPPESTSPRRARKQPENLKTGLEPSPPNTQEVPEDRGGLIHPGGEI